MDMKLIFGFLMAGLLLFGCTGQTTQPANQTTPTTSTQTPVTTTPVTTTVTDLTNLGWGELIALGTPVECTVTYKESTEGIKDIKLYMKGMMFKETFTMTQDGKDIPTSVISKNDGYIYIRYNDPSFMSSMTMGKIQCDGLAYKTDVTETSASSPVDTTALEDSSKVSLNCKPAIFGDEMFSTAGKYCTMTEITTAITGDLCGQLTDPVQKAQCEQALNG